MNKDLPLCLSFAWSWMIAMLLKGEMAIIFISTTIVYILLKYEQKQEAKYETI